MMRSHSITPGLLAIALLTGMAYSSFWSQPEPVSHGHGLRIYLDPDSGQYARPPEPTTKITPEFFSVHTLLGKATTNPSPLREQASPKSNGGYTIELREQFRPVRRGS